jgi:hypothetical protein
MKSLIIALLSLVFINTSFAQNRQSVDTIDAANLKAIKSKNVKITDASLDKYVGTWVWKNDNASLTIQLNTTVYHLGKILLYTFNY